MDVLACPQCTTCLDTNLPIGSPTHGVWASSVDSRGGGGALLRNGQLDCAQLQPAGVASWGSCPAIVTTSSGGQSMVISNEQGATTFVSYDGQ